MPQPVTPKNNDMLIRLNRTTASDLAGITLGTNDVSEDVVNRRGWQKPKLNSSIKTYKTFYN